MYTVNRTNAFKKSFKRALKRGLNPAAFQKVIDILQTEGSLPRQYKPIGSVQNSTMHGNAILRTTGSCFGSKTIMR